MPPPKTRFAICRRCRENLFHEFPRCSGCSAPIVSPKGSGVDRCGQCRADGTFRNAIESTNREVGKPVAAPICGYAALAGALVLYLAILWLSR